MGHRPLIRESTLNTQVDGVRRRVERLERRYIPSFAGFEIKVFADENALDGNLPASATNVVTGDAKFVFMVPADADNYWLVRVQAFVSTVGSGNTDIQIRNITTGADMLTIKVTIPSGEYDSCETAYEINTNQDQVDACDRLAIDVDAAGAGAKGLGVLLLFSDTAGQLDEFELAPPEASTVSSLTSLTTARRVQVRPTTTILRRPF